MAQMFQLTSDDVCYVSMPLFHSNALMTAWAPALVAGATLALRERFSASQLPLRCPDASAPPTSTTWASPSPTSWTPRSGPTTPTTRCAGCSATRRPRPTWPDSPSGSAARCRTPTAPPKAGPSVQRTPDTPRGALGRALPGTMVVDPETGEECPRAVFDEHGRLLNAEEAIGEMVNPDRRGRVRGLLAQRRGRGGPGAQRLVLDRGPGLPGRERLLLLRRPRLRLVAGRRGELRRRPGRRAAPAAPRRRAGLGLRRARHRGR